MNKKVIAKDDIFDMKMTDHLIIPIKILGHLIIFTGLAVFGTFIILGHELIAAGKEKLIAK